MTPVSFALSTESQTQQRVFVVIWVMVLVNTTLICVRVGSTLHPSLYRSQ